MGDTMIRNPNDPFLISPDEYLRLDKLGWIKKAKWIPSKLGSDTLGAFAVRLKSPYHMKYFTDHYLYKD
jgi:hypothetical protein